MKDKKIITVLLYKKEIIYDINALTYKMAEASMQEIDLRSKNAVQSDDTDTLDGSIIKRLIEHRDNHLKMKLTWCIADNNDVIADNIPNENNILCYKFEVPLAFKGSLVSVLASKMHEYIVHGSLSDWYRKCGLNYQFFESEAQELESDITSILRQSHSRRPMQPFGPAENYH